MNDDDVYSEISAVKAELQRLKDEASQKAIDHQRQALAEEGKASAYQMALVQLARIEFPQ